jgi:hypothetical protein
MFLSLIIFFLLNVYIYFNSSFLALFGFLFSSHVLFHLHFFVVFYSASFLSIFFSIRFHCLQSYNHQAPNCKFFFYYYAQKFLELLRRRRYSFSFHSPSQLSFIAFSSQSWKSRQIFLSATFLFQSVVINRRDIQRRYNCQSHIRFYWPLEAAIATTLYAASIYAPFVRLLTAKCDLHYVFHLVKNV